MDENEVLSEEITEEAAEENTSINENSSEDFEILTILKSIDEKIGAMQNESEDESEEVTEEITEEVTEEVIEEVNEEVTEVPSIVYIDPSADTHSYLSTPVENASLNDCFTLGLSIRNILLLFFLVWIGMKLFSMIKSVVYRIMNR